nr:DoxX family protein [Cyclobacterium marinum]
MRNSGNSILRISIGLIFFWFGLVKFFPGVSPAENLASSTICAITLHVTTPPVCTILLAIFESLTGLLLITGKFLKPVLILLFLHMLGTLLTFIIFPDLMFEKFPFVLTMQGQYVMKNVTILASIPTIWPKEDSKKKLKKGLGDHPHPEPTFESK